MDNNIIHIFPPDTQEHFGYALGGSLVFLLCLGLFIWAWRKNKKLPLLFAGFVGITALGTALFSTLTQNRLHTVELRADGINIGAERLDFNEIRRIDLEELPQHSKYPIHREGKAIVVDSSSLLVVEEYAGKAHVLSRENYPIDSIFSELSVILNAWKEENGEGKR